MELQEVQKSRPIPRGGAKIAALVVMNLLVGFGAAMIAFLWGWFESVGFWVCGSVVSGFMLVMDVFAAHDKLFRDYWWRNVKGYILWCWEDENGVRYDIVKPWDFRLVLALPLGGWFKRGRVWLREGRNFLEDPVWKVEAVWKDFFHVRLTDRHGDCVHLLAEQALKYLYYAHTCSLATSVDGCGVGGWMTLLGLRERGLDDANRERDEAQRNLKEALAQIVGTIDHLDATKRFIRSKQAQEIRRGLVCELDRLLPPDDPRREKYILATTTRCTTGLGCCEAIPIAPI